MTEYIIIVVIIALAALAVFGLFGDRIRQMVGGATQELGGDESAVSDAVGEDGDSLQYLKDIGTEWSSDALSEKKMLARFINNVFTGIAKTPRTLFRLDSCAGRAQRKMCHEPKHSAGMKDGHTYRVQ